MKSVIVILMDACRYDHINEDTTPNIMRIARKGVNYTNWHAGNSNTRLSVPIMLCGKDFYNSLESIMHTLRKKDYRSVILYSSPLVDFEFARVGWDYSIDNYGRKRSPKGRLRKFRQHVPRFVYGFIRLIYRWYQSRESYLPHIMAQEMLKSALNIIKTFDDKPYFLWIHLMDPHAPYYPSVTDYSHRELARINDRVMDAVWWKYTPTSDEVEVWRSLYKDQVSEMDVQIGKFYDELDWDDKVLIITADHGEEFGDRGAFGHPPNRFVPELLHVPMVVVNGSDKGVVDRRRTHYEFLDVVRSEALR